MAEKLAKGVRCVNGELYKFIPPVATETELGGIIAKAKTIEDKEVVIDNTTGKLYVDSAVDSEVSQARQGNDGSIFSTLQERLGTDFTSIYNEVQARTNELQGQIDNIVLTSSDSGDVTAEVVQARVDKNGTNYATLKERIDSTQSETELISEDLYHNYQNLNYIVDYLENVNLNDYKVAGNYKVRSAAEAATIQNIPEAIAGRLTVMVTTKANRTIQIYVTNASVPKVYMRYFDGTKWNDWNKLVNDTDLDNYQNLNYTIEEISNVNLDDYKTPSNYKIRSAANAKTIQNIPEEIAGRLTVMATTESGRVLQTYITNSSTPRIYTRFFDGTAWKEWDKFASGKALDSLSEKCVTATNTTITSSNYTNYFTDYNDIPVNTVYDITTGVPLLNSPPGNTLVDRDGEETGYLGGVVITFCGKSDKSRSVCQIFATRSTAIEQTFLCFRMAYPVDGVLQWSPWQKMSNHNNLTASNVAIRKEISTRFFSDFNDAPINSIYQIDLDCDEGTLANHPNPGRSCVLVTLGFSPTSRHGMVQLCFGMISSVDHALWYRYGYKQSADEYRWTKWNRVGDSNTTTDTGTYMINKGRLADGTDLNAIEENAIYLLSGGGGYSNVPPGGGNGFITVKTVEGVTMQVYEKFSGKRWTRYKTTSSEWSEWVE